MNESLETPYRGFLIRASRTIRTCPKSQFVWSHFAVGSSPVAPTTASSSHLQRSPAPLQRLHRPPTPRSTPVSTASPPLTFARQQPLQPHPRGPLPLAGHYQQPSDSKVPIPNPDPDPASPAVPQSRLEHQFTIPTPSQAPSPSSSLRHRRCIAVAFPAVAAAGLSSLAALVQNMSWNLTKKLKETHLGFSKSSTPSSGKEKTKDKSGTSTPSDVNSISDANGASTIEALTQAPVVKPPKPGILVITLYEARGLSLPEAYQDVLSAGHSTGAHSAGDALAARTGASTRNPSAFSGSLDRPQSASVSGFKGIPTNHGRVSGKYMPYALVDFDKNQIFVNSVDGNPENPVWAGSNTQYKFDVSRAGEVTVQLFMRNPTASAGSGRTQDIFLGSIRVNPRFESASDAAPSGKKGQSDRPQPQGHSGLGWFELQNGTGKLQIGVDFVENRVGKLTIDDFDLLTLVGRGSFGKVMQVRKKDTGRIYAIKTIRKAKIISRSEVTHTLAERSVLAQINNPFIVPLKFSFQSPEKLYFVLAFVNGGELFFHLSKEGRFDINRSRFYTAELLCALECLHGFNVIYRDLKPENILLDYQGHIALCDFGLCKLEMKDEDSTKTFVGTPEYLAPELLKGEGYGKTVDWWTLGVLLYEMLTGLPPFYDENTNEMYRKILTAPLNFPGYDIVPPAARDLLTKLLDRDPTKRLGVNGSTEIKSHPFFHGIDWKKLLQRKYEPTFKPNVANALDTANFSEEFTEQPAQDSLPDDFVLSKTMQDQFVNFSYNRPVAGLDDAGGSIKDPSFLEASESRGRR
ncbi:serine threonine- kinase gad8 [Trichoderma arundinaceum]|uniref:non-specific serine/threonine protein kinase n=1 Tax=Trichoderma arundinaceum TaxID=490622 RepID=A0A395NZW5_TRIAR|nr:serine threonine- kinase gad8 [Trichoderma arundinaceum]